jgi:hypothetical protein
MNDKDPMDIPANKRSLGLNLNMCVLIRQPPITHPLDSSNQIKISNKLPVLLRNIWN